jgi:hypothetical protein
LACQNNSADAAEVWQNNRTKDEQMDQNEAIRELQRLNRRLWVLVFTGNFAFVIGVSLYFATAVAGTPKPTIDLPDLVDRVSQLESDVEESTRTKVALRSEIEALKRKNIRIVEEVAGQMQVVLSMSGLTCRGLTIVDKGSKPRIQLLTGEEHGDGLIRLLDGNAKIRASIETNNEGMAFVRLHDAAQRARLALGVHNDGNSTILHANGDGVIQTSYGVSDGVPKLAFQDRAGQEKTVFKER